MKRALIILTILAAAWLLPACSGAAGEQKASIAGGTSADGPVSAEQTNPAIAAQPTSTVQSSGVDSVYTDIGEKACKTTELNADEGWSVQKCRGAFGYDIEVREGRSSGNR